MLYKAIVIAALTAAAVFSACGGDTIDPPSAPPQLITDSVKMLGRTYYKNDTLWCVHSGTGVEFSFTGTLSITITGDSTASRGDTHNQARIAIYENGERIIDNMITKPEMVYTFVRSNNTVIKIVKLSESLMSFFGIKSIECDGEIKPTQDKEMLIEFIGDSITCGYGIDAVYGTSSFSTTTEDFTKAYAYKTAELLDADYSVVALSGYGIISGYTGGPINSTETMPQYYDKVGFSRGTVDGFIPSETAWDFSVRQPDIVVINLGTNDSSYCGSNAERRAAFTAGYEEFINKVRSHNPDALILCMLGIMNDNLFTPIQNAVVSFKLAGGSNILTMKFDVQQQSDGLATDYHPSATTNTKAAQKLAAFITQNLP